MKNGRGRVLKREKIRRKRRKERRQREREVREKGKNGIPEQSNMGQKN